MHLAMHVFPSDTVSEFCTIAAGLLAVSVGVFAFTPLIMELAVKRATDPDKAVEQTRKAGRAFDLLLLSIGALGLDVGLGILLQFWHNHPAYVCQVVLLSIGLALLWIGVLGLGLLFRQLRKL
jgi:hypothetical protein